jgi:hypothetical protein
MKLKLTLLLAASLTFLCPNWSQTCNYLAYEPFDNADGTALHESAGGSGWGEAWQVQNSDATLPGYQFETGSLTAGTVQNFGNKGAGGFSSLTAGRRLDTSSSGPFGALTNVSNAIGLDGTTLWFSIILQKNSDNPTAVFTELNSDLVGWVIQPAQPHIGLGYYGSDSDVGGERRWSLRINDTVYPSSESVNFGTPTLAVFGITFNSTSGHQIDLYIDPLLGTTPPSPTMTQNYNGDLEFRSLAIFGNNPNEANFDEIRFSTSFQCVAPDTGVAVNLPPTAVISAAPSNGIAPLSVTLNAAASIDPDDGIVQYEWNFGDGSSPFIQATPNSFTHVFNNLGVNSVELKVTDSQGSTHLITQNIIVTDASASFSCQAGASLTPASCGSSDGSIEVLNAWNSLVQSHSLMSVSGTNFSPTGNQYNNLAPGDYSLSVTGVYGCTNAFDLKVLVDSTTCSGWSPATCRLDFGMNLNFPTYYAAERPFKNLFRLNGGFYSVDAATPWIPTGQYDNMPQDADGYPMEVPWSGNLIKVVISDNSYFPQETLVVLYDGEGDIQCTESTQNISPGRFEITVNTDGQILFDILSSSSGNHIRNIRVLRAGDEFDDLSTSPFHDNFLDRLEPFRSIRFMNWMGINHSSLSNWSQRTLPNKYDQSSANIGGVAYEYMIELCNTLNRDPWICIPHQADNDYITQLSTLFSNNLNPDLNVYIEYSNEVWNWNFGQAHWVTDNGATNISYPRRYTERATQAMNLFRDQFGATSRVKRVLGTQLTHNWLTDEILAHADPTDYEYISPSAYFGWSGGSCESSLNASSSALDIINCTRTTFLEQFPSWKRDYYNARMYGKEVINYESGNHMTDFNPNVPFAQAIRDAQTHPEINNLYQEVIDKLRELDSRLSMYFVLAARLHNSVDVFGHLDDIDQTGPFNTTAPKYQTLLDNINNCYDLTTSILPIDLTELRAEIIWEQTRLTWGTISEIQNEGFEIERSNNGLYWEKIGFVRAQGTSTDYQSYQFIDSFPKAGINYYRLKQFDFDGKFEYSNIAHVTFETDPNHLEIYPNPFSNELNFSKNVSGEIMIYNSLGQTVFNSQLKFENKIKLSSLPKGQYWVQVLKEGREILVKKLLKF